MFRHEHHISSTCINWYVGNAVYRQGYQAVIQYCTVQKFYQFGSLSLTFCYSFQIHLLLSCFIFSSYCNGVWQSFVWAIGAPLGGDCEHALSRATLVAQADQTTAARLGLRTGLASRGIEQGFHTVSLVKMLIKLTSGYVVGEQHIS